MRTLTIAAIQTAPVAFDVDASWERFAARVHAVRDTFPHVELVVVPELMLAAEAPLLQARERLDAPGRRAHSRARPPTGSAALAKETGLWLVPGSLYERGDDGNVYNTAIAVSPLGEIVATYRKVFPWQPYEQTDTRQRVRRLRHPRRRSDRAWRSATTARSPRPRANSPGSAPR